MSVFVLVHGAWQTAATWDLVTPRLEEAGHTVVVPLLRGLENDAELTPSINLTTHVQDVVSVLNEQNLESVILAGHSYAGMVITAVAEQALDRLERLVYVDAFVPSDGQAALDLLPPPVERMFQEQAERDGAGWRLRAGEGQLDMWGLKPGPEREFVRSRLSDFSLRCFAEPVRLPANSASRVRRTYIACVGEGYPARPIFQQFGERAKREGWMYQEMPTGHDCHVEMPDGFVSRLLAQSAGV